MLGDFAAKYRALNQMEYQAEVPELARC
jgi:hypothetical protein